MSFQAGVIPVSTVTTKTSATTSSAHNRVTYNTSKTLDTVRHSLTDDGQGASGQTATSTTLAKASTCALLTRAAAPRATPQTTKTPKPSSPRP